MHLIKLDAIENAIENNISVIHAIEHNLLTSVYYRFS